MIAVVRRVRRLVTCLGHTLFYETTMKRRLLQMDCTRTTKSTFKKKGIAGSKASANAAMQEKKKERMKGMITGVGTVTQTHPGKVIICHIQSRRPKMEL